MLNILDLPVREATGNRFVSSFVGTLEELSMEMFCFFVFKLIVRFGARSIIPILMREKGRGSWDVLHANLAVLPRRTNSVLATLLCGGILGRITIPVQLGIRRPCLYDSGRILAGSLFIINLSRTSRSRMRIIPRLRKPSVLP